MTMNAIKKRQLFNLFGGAIIVLWIVMIGLLVRKVHFKSNEKHIEIESNPAAFETGHRDWMEIYLKDSKIGYSMTQINPFGEDYLIWEEILLKLNLMGQASVMRTSTRSIVDRAFLLKSFISKIDSGIVSFRVSGKVEGQAMHIDVGEGSGKKTHTIRLSGPPVIGSGMSQFFKGRPLKVGESFKFLIFDPSTMAQKGVLVTVAAEEPLVINRIRYRTFRLETEMWGQDLIFWLDEGGNILKEKGFMGLTLVKSNAATARRDLAGGKVYDFYEMASIDVKPKLKGADRLTSLRLKVEGLEGRYFNTDVLNQGRQGFRDGTLEIIQEKRPFKATYAIPFTDQSGEMKPYLGPEFNIQSDDKAIVETAREVVGDKKDPVYAAERLMEWVYRSVEKKPVISVPSAAEVLRTRAGDCNEHAVLLTALLRAAKIPARECVGLVYANDRFFYHAWTEGYFGRWISMDATLNQMPTDATHIKLVHGGLEKQADIIALIGKLKVKILDYGYD
ncbi:MAG: transglutaminase domain-containing protein [Desulfobacteraceae bacterium]|nr:transglutaminase domain-containing protein [Desulfobacteraceae bacterium]